MGYVTFMNILMLKYLAMNVICIQFWVVFSYPFK